MAGEIDEKGRKAWDPSSMGYGKHAYRRLDPLTVNPQDFATGLRGEEQYFGDVREYEVAFNQKNPESTFSLDWAGRIGTVFSTNVEPYAGIWMVVDMPLVKSPTVFVRASRVEKFNPEECEKNLKGRGPVLPGGEIVAMSAVDLGLMVDEKNFYREACTKMLYRGILSRDQKAVLDGRATDSLGQE